MMRYLITFPKGSENLPFFTDWFDIENNYNSELEMIVYDLHHHLYYDGKSWKTIEEDHL